MAAAKISPIAWVFIAIAATYAVARIGFNEELQRAKKAAKDKLALPPGLDRLPRPDFAVEIPKTKKDINGVDILLCEAFEEATKDEQYLYVLNELYPEFPWPAIYADHPTTQQLQGIVQFRINQAYAMIPNDPAASQAQFCTAVTPPIEFHPQEP